MKAKKYLASFLIIIIIGLLGMFEIRHLKRTFSKTPKEKLLIDMKKAIKEAKDSFLDVSIRQSAGQKIVTSTEQFTDNTSTEILSKEQLENLKKKILNLEHEKKR